MNKLHIVLSALLVACSGGDDKQHSTTYGPTDYVWKFMTETGCKTGEEVVGQKVTPTTLSEWGCTKMQEQGPRVMFDCSNVPDLGTYFIMTQEQC